MTTIYCISGLGADERAFSKLSIIEGYRLKVLPWLQPLKNELITQYAKRMLAAIDEPEPVLLGLSFGGIMCIEIAKQIPVKKIIIVSSIKTTQELPLWMKAVAWSKLNKIVPLKSTRLSAPLQNYMLGVTNKEDLAVAAHYRKHADITYVKWAVDKVLNWKNTWVHPEIYHIHGGKDKLFPIKNTTPDCRINDAGHFMVMNRSEAVSKFINEVLQKGSSQI